VLLIDPSRYLRATPWLSRRQATPLVRIGTCLKVNYLYKPTIYTTKEKERKG